MHKYINIDTNIFTNKRFVFLREMPDPAEAAEAEKKYKKKVEKEIKEESLKETLEDEEMTKAPDSEHPSITPYMEKVDKILEKLNKKSRRYPEGKYSHLIEAVKKDLKENAVKTLNEKNQAKYEAAQIILIEKFMGDTNIHGGRNLNTYKTGEGKPQFLKAYLQAILGGKVFYPKENWDSHFKSAIQGHFGTFLMRVRETPGIKIDNPERGDVPENEKERNIARTVASNDPRIHGYIVGLLSLAATKIGGEQNYTNYRNYIVGQLAQLPKETTYEEFRKNKSNFLTYDEYMKATGYELDKQGKVSNEAERKNNNYLNIDKSSSLVKIGLGIPSSKDLADFTEDENKKYEEFSDRMKNMITKSFYEHQICEAVNFYKDDWSIKRYKKHLLAQIMEREREPGDIEGILTPSEFTEKEDERAAIIKAGKDIILKYLSDTGMKPADRIWRIKKELTPEQKTALTTRSNGKTRTYRKSTEYIPTTRGARRMEIRIVPNPRDKSEIDVTGRWNNISKKRYETYLAERKRRREEWMA